MIKNILFIVDDLEFKYFEFNKLVTNFWLIYELLRRNYNVMISTKNKLFVENGKGFVLCWKSYIKDNNIFYEGIEQKLLINDFEVVFFRPDPPVDIDYISACYVFDFVDKTKTFIINNPAEVKNFNEKLHINYFQDFIPKNIVTSSKKLIKKFIDENETVIIKPLNRCFGSGVYYIKSGDKNTNTIIDNLTNSEKTYVMVQKYIPSNIKGDKRVLIVGKNVLDECIVKLASSDDFKFNSHSDEYFEKSILSKREKDTAQAVANFLYEKGIYFVGLDMIDEKIIEINVTSPCYFIKEINNFYNKHLERDLVDMAEQTVNEFFAKRLYGIGK